MLCVLLIHWGFHYPPQVVVVSSSSRIWHKIQLLPIIFPVLLNLVDVAGILITLALVEYIQAPIAPSHVKFFTREMPTEVRSVHSMKPATIWVVFVRDRVVTTADATAPPTASSFAAATASIGVEFGDPTTTLALVPPSRPWRELYFHLGGHVGDGSKPIYQ